VSSAKGWHRRPPMPRQLHLNVNIGGTGLHPGSWRWPGANPQASTDITHYQTLAREAERGRLDAVFMSDGVLLKGDVRKGPPPQIMDPTVLVAGMAVVTQRVGLIASVSTTFNSPYHIARVFASLDHLSGGRVGWNVVTTRDLDAGLNYGLADLPRRTDRYARAAEAIEVVTKLWDSWEDDAVIADPVQGVWADPGRIHRIDHEGDLFSVRGPLQVPRPPQGRIPLVQAGGSATGRDLAAHYADVVFTVQPLLGLSQAFYADIKERARGYGRDPESIAILPGLNTIIGGTEAEARQRERELNERVGQENLLAGFARRMGVDPGDLDLEQPFPAHLLRATGDTYGSTGFDDATRSLVKAGLSVRELIIATMGGHPTVVGAPEQVADRIEGWFVQRAADGFNIQCDVYPGGLTDFVDQVVPELRRRGLFRSEYAGSTLREHLGLTRPVSCYAKDGWPWAVTAGSQ
jgi:FMN-dependent oxidoreductase (nitrilotriacetate monooxygenase family)